MYSILYMCFNKLNVKYFLGTKRTSITSLSIDFSLRFPIIYRRFSLRRTRYISRTNIMQNFSVGWDVASNRWLFPKASKCAIYFNFILSREFFYSNRILESASRIQSQVWNSLAYSTLNLNSSFICNGVSVLSISL